MRSTIKIMISRTHACNHVFRCALQRALNHKNHDREHRGGSLTKVRYCRTPMQACDAPPSGGAGKQAPTHTWGVALTCDARETKNKKSSTLVN